MCPERMWCSGTFASADSSRMVISDLLISSEKIAEVRPFLMEHALEKSRARVLLPIAGRAAMMIIWPACRPLVIWSSSEKPVGTPTLAPPREEIASISSIVPCSSCSRRM